MPRLRPIKSLSSWKTSTIRTDGLPSELQVGRRKVPDYRVVKTKRGEVYPESPIKPCSAKQAKRKCHAQLVFLGRKGALRFGVNPGAYLRMCTTQGKTGYVVPVSNHREASRIARKFCECREAGGTRVKCARQVGAEKKVGRRRRR